MLYHHCPTRHLTVPRDVLDTSLVASFWSPVWLVKWYVSTGETSLLIRETSTGTGEHIHIKVFFLLEATFLLFVAPPTVGQGLTLHKPSSNHSLTFNPQLILNSLFILPSCGCLQKGKISSQPYKSTRCPMFLPSIHPQRNHSVTIFQSQYQFNNFFTLFNLEIIGETALN